MTSKQSYLAGCLCIQDAQDLEVMISHDGKTLWVNGPYCILRVGGIRGRIEIKDYRAVKPTDDAA